MDIAAAGHFIIFFSILVATVIVSIIVLAYAGYSFLVAFIDTAAGADEIIWPGDPVQDWFFKGWYLTWLLAVWAVPPTLLAGLLGLERWLCVLAAAAVLWLLFPVTLLSSLSASSAMLIFRPVIVRLLLKQFRLTVAFYAVSGMIVAICGSLFSFGMTGPFAVVPAVAIVGAIGFLIYARLLGRVAWVITWQDPAAKKREKRPEEADRIVSFDPWSGPWEKAKNQSEARQPPRSQQVEPPPRKKKPRLKKRSRAYDPWAASPDEPRPTPAKSARPFVVQQEPDAPSEGTYELMPEQSSPAPPIPAAARADVPAPDSQSYELSPLSASEPPKLPPAAPPAVSKLEEELAAPRQHAPPPPRPLVSAVYSFPFYQRTLPALVTLILGFFASSALLYALIALWPKGD